MVGRLSFQPLLLSKGREECHCRHLDPLTLDSVVGASKAWKCPPGEGALLEFAFGLEFEKSTATPQTLLLWMYLWVQPKQGHPGGGKHPLLPIPYLLALVVRHGRGEANGPIPSKVVSGLPRKTQCFLIPVPFIVPFMTRHRRGKQMPVAAGGMTRKIQHTFLTI